MAWMAVPCVLEARDQMNRRFPNREKGAEGILGDTSHKASASSHNPDLTGNPEYRDGDDKDEVRAFDFDRDLRDPGGVTMEDVVQLWVRKAKEGKMPWLRYLIYNKRIWHKRDNWAEKPYTGSNNHSDHVHGTTDFSEYADTVTGTNWFLDELGRSTPAPAPIKPAPVHPTLRKGMVNSQHVYNVQIFFKRTFPAYRYSVQFRIGEMIDTDGNFGPQTESWVKEFQRRVGIVRDGVVGPVTLGKLRAYGYRY